MTVKDIVTILVPVMVALISGLYAYLQTRKSSSVEDGKLSLAGYESLNKSQATEIDRIRADREEDRKNFHDERIRDRAEIDELKQRLREVTRKSEQQSDRFNDLVRWTRQITRIFNDPGLIRILAASDVHIPPPPTWTDET